MLGKMASLFVQFLGVIFIARDLGASSFGILSIAYIPINLAAILMNIGTNSALIKFISQSSLDDKPHQRRIFIETGFVINLSLGMILTVILYFSSSFIAETILDQPDLNPLIKLYSFILIGQTLFNTTNSILVGYERMEQKSIIDTIYNLLRSFVSPIFVYLGWGVIGAVSGYVLSSLVAGLIGFFIVVSIWKSEPMSVQSLTRLECTKLMLSYGYPLFFSNLLGGVSSNVINFLLALYVSPEYIGNYQAATRFGALVTFFTIPIDTVMVPLLSKLETQIDALRAVFVNSVKYVGLIIYPIIAIVIALAPEIVTVLYGQGYPNADTFLRQNMLTFCYIGFGAIGADALIIIKNTQIRFHQALISFIVTLSLGFLLIPLLGVTGLIIASFIGSLVSLTYGLHWVRKNLAINPDYNAAFKTMVAAFSAGFATHVFINIFLLDPWIKLILGGVVHILLYLVSIMLLNVLKHTDLDNIENISRGFEPVFPYVKQILTFVRTLLKP